ncbi:16318_t:CDS:2 [Funneliformis geosporum]|nr:16318_t:CDS:2 [Funneliformis geosporum]
MSKRDYDKFYLTLQRLKVELYLSYKDIGFNELIVNSKIRWYELATYIIEENNDEEFKEFYAIVKGIFPT